ncbi:MAG: glycosyltransferase [Candidatus Hydrogenedentota bacterium]|nr:MAG: glycosyltransferase [Candidatus Hydrogenedentota bacterium]
MIANGPMRRSVCLLTNAYPDFPDSNRVVFIRSLAELLSRKGWTVSVLAPRIFPGSRRREREGKVEVRRFPSFMGGKLLIEYSRTPIFRLMGYMASGLLLAQTFVRKQRCQLIHAHWVIPAGLIAIIVGRVCNVPVIVTAHGSDILVVPKRSALLRRFVRSVLKQADAVTSVAEHLTREIVEMGVLQDRLLTFPMSVPTESFCADGPTAHGRGTETLIFSNRGLYPVYNVELLVRAVPSVLRKIPDARVSIAGEGPEADKLASLAHELGVSERVRLLGSIPHGQMPEYLRGASVYVSTALSDGESVSLLEAMACGTFPVVADIPANREWIEDGKNGFLFPPGDAEALAEKIQACIRHPDLRAKAREINIGFIQQRAQWSLNVEKLLGLYERVMRQ